jgi:adenine phosphoribosyltransferase
MHDHEFLPSEHSVRYLKSRLRNIPDFPKPGILFKDITPLLADPRAFHITIDLFTERFLSDAIAAVIGIESRGFIFGAALAARLNASFVPVRKPGKLPYKTDRVAYKLEYGEAELEMHKDSLSAGTRALIVDDLLATGGTASAAAALAARQGAVLVAHAFVVELDFLEGQKRLVEGVEAPPLVYSLVHFGAGE